MKGGIVAVLLLILLASGCVTPGPTATPVPTSTLAPAPTLGPAPTSTPELATTAIPTPTPSPAPTSLAAVPAPTPTSVQKDQRIPTELVCVTPGSSIGPTGGYLKAILLGPDKRPMPEQKILWSAGRGDIYIYPFSSLTDKAGVAESRYIVPWDLGIEWTDTVTITFQGDANYSPSSCEMKVVARSPAMPKPPSPTAPPPVSPSPPRGLPTPFVPLPPPTPLTPPPPPTVSPTLTSGLNLTPLATTTPTSLKACPGFEVERAIILRAMPELENPLFLQRELRCHPYGVSGNVAVAAGHFRYLSITRYASEQKVKGALGTPNASFRGYPAVHKARTNYPGPQSLEESLTWQAGLWLFSASSFDDTGFLGDPGNWKGRYVDVASEHMFSAAVELGLIK